MQNNEIVENVLNALTVVSERVMPRILSQICRDENSPFFGCADRNWWHYKMRDFPSIILQQTGATLHSARGLKSFSGYPEEIKTLSIASCKFWNERAARFRSFEEYYPWEEGYPPLAFSTLSTARMVAEAVIDIDDVMPGIKIASKQLLSRFESEAANQQVAGLAALSWIYRISPCLVSLSEINVLLEKTLQLQDEEGWFNEYGGPDLGYLSVTIDCLWDSFDAIGDFRLIDSAKKALNFLDEMTCNTNGDSIGMHNARNTDYIVPYGITRFLDDSIAVEFQRKSLRLLKNIFSKSDCNKHFFSSVDDRYWCHYIGLSVVRSVQVLATINLKKSINLENDKYDEYSNFPSCGYVWNDLNQGQFKVLTSMKKGGNFTAFSDLANFSDYGWIAQSKAKNYVSHWWSDDWELKSKEGCCTVTGYLFSHSVIQSNPLNHFLLRASSFIMGKRLIGLLKQKLIFKKKKNIISFIRRIDINQNSIMVVDRFDNHPADCIFIRAPRSSKRHVASADSFHFEDLSLLNYKINEKKVVSNNDTTITTTYLLSD
jgi:hypothetical protein